MKVLLVDDEKDFVAALSERLELRGIEADVETDGESALKRIESDPPQVVVLDVMMPGVGGVEVMRRIKMKHPNLPVLLLTGHGSISEGSVGKAQGAFDYLAKPIDIDELIAKMKEALKAGGGR
jgi:DNA-binding response OmpR family regulator